MTTIPSLTFHDGKQAPQLGFGVWQIADDTVEGVVTQALELGYRSVDTAAIYDNERGVGRGIAKSGIARDQLFVATKLWNTEHGHE
ncbi:MAG TPA: aldo/keto reductase, partial [Burkholderiaceae bacterium]|nr:aldo/keto reductase [Burkholderiaceae bacterium]